jgi:hypothetical protein
VTFDEQVTSFMELFQGSVRSVGLFNPKLVGSEAGPHTTARRAPTRADFEKHLRGQTGVGIVPIQRDKFCTWGAIDIDVDTIDHSTLEQTVRGDHLPLVVCRSKSGGAHVYLFLKEAVLATAVRAALVGFAKRIGYAAAEIFPKQNETSEDIIGSWINLPYFGGDTTTRNAIVGGKQVNLDFFLETARDVAVSRVSLFNSKEKAEHVDAPPCVISMIHNGVGPGMRNGALFTIATYLKRAFPDNWKDKVFDVNASFTDPLPAEEIRKTILSSLSRRDFLYKCKEEPCKSLCDSNVCVTRKFGITPAEQKTIVNVDSPVFGGLKKFTTEPVYWEMEVNGLPVRLSTDDLADYKRLRLRVMDWQTRLLPPMKQGDWDVILDSLMNGATIIEAPDEASAPGQVRQALRDYIEKAAMLESANDRENLLRGMPCVEEDSGKTIAMFVGTAFQDYLKKNRKEEVRGAQIWMALRKMEVGHKRVRVRGESMNVWWCELQGGAPVLAKDLTIPDFNPEF